MDEVLRKHGGPNNELTKGLCMTVSKSATVTVRERWISEECVDVKERTSTHCFWVENVSGKKREDTSPYPWSSYYWGAMTPQRFREMISTGNLGMARHSLKIALTHLELKKPRRRPQSHYAIRKIESGLKHEDQLLSLVMKLGQSRA